MNPNDNGPSEIEVSIEKLERALNEANIDPIDCVSLYLNCALDEMRKGKPNDRSQIDRQWAICITELENVVHIFDGRVARHVDDFNLSEQP